MMHVSRREMLLSGIAAAGMAGAASLSVNARPQFSGTSEYGLAPGLIYLNTAALGPTPRFVLDKVLAGWYELELNPVIKAYGDYASHVATDRARGQIAASTIDYRYAIKRHRWALKTPPELSQT